MKGYPFIFLLIIILASLNSGCIDITGEIQKQKVIVNQVQPLIKNGAPSQNSNDLVLRGKALIWDMTKNYRSPAYDQLPDNLKASSSDKVITVLMIQGARSVKVGTYSISGEPAYRNYTDIFVVYWPENKTAGLYSIVSAEPRSSRPVQYNEEYGDPNKPIADWISNLRKE